VLVNDQPKDNFPNRSAHDLAAGAVETPMGHKSLLPFTVGRFFSSVARSGSGTASSAALRVGGVRSRRAAHCGLQAQDVG
jgi:hypothetical protein